MSGERPPSNTAVILRIVSDIEKKLDDFEQRILKMEEQYNQALESLNSGAIADKIEEGKDRLKQGVDDFLESLKGMFKKKDD